MTTIIAISLSVFSIGTYLVWPSRWNIPAHFGLGLVFTAYVVPVFLTNTLNDFPRELLEFYATLTSISAVCFLIGLFCGSALPRLKLSRHALSFISLDEAALRTFVSRRALWIGLFSIAVMVLTFQKMGFVPLFAADQVAAKYLAGEYHDRIGHLAILLLIGERTIILVIPIQIVLWYVTRRNIFILLVIVEAVLQAMTLSRTGFGLPIIMGVGLIAASRSYKAFVPYLLFVAFAVAIGSAINYYTVLLVAPELARFQQYSMWDQIADGAPNIHDALRFFWAFNEHPQFMYGKVFFGAVLPFNDSWNLGMWAMRVANRDPLQTQSETLSGGLDLPAPILGYTAFGWSGAVVVCFLSGMAAGYGAVFAKRYVGKGSLLQSVIALTLYNTVVNQLTEFYYLEKYRMFAVFLALILSYQIRLRAHPVTMSPSTVPA